MLEPCSLQVEIRPTDAFLQSRSEPAKLVDDAWLLTLSRTPTDAERKPFEEMLAKAAPEEKRQIVEDMYWSLLTSREFLFRH